MQCGYRTEVVAYQISVTCYRHVLTSIPVTDAYKRKPAILLVGRRDNSAL